MAKKPKPDPPDIDALIRLIEGLKQQIQVCQKKDFRTSAQNRMIAEHDNMPWKLALLHTKDPDEFEKHFGLSIDRYFRPTGSLDKGQFARVIGTVVPGNIRSAYDDEGAVPYELYNPERHCPPKFITRYDFDKDAFWNFIRQFTACRRREYWKEHIAPSISKIDVALTPWIPAAKNLDMDIRTGLVSQTAENPNPKKLDKLLHDLKRLKQIEIVPAKPPATTESPKSATPGGGASKQTDKTKKRKEDAQATHTPDFRVVYWYGKTYKFKKNQATAIGLLWQAWEDPEKVGVHEAEIGKAVETVAKNYRLMETFRQRCKGKGKKGFHPAWKELIKHVGAHVYRLRIPKQDSTKSS